jgi:hypothetical protein
MRHIGRAVGNFWAPLVPAARVAWLRRVIYPFVIVDVLVFVRDPIPHGDVPTALYRPLLVRQLLHLPEPSPVYVRVLFGVLLLSALVAATGRLPRAAGWVCALAMLDWLSNGMSYGKVDHDHFALVVALFVLPTVGRVRTRDREPDAAAGWAVRMVQFAVVACYCLAAWAKVRQSGWGWASGSTLTWALTRRGKGLAEILAGQPTLIHVMQWVSWTAEFCSPLMLWLRGRPLYAYLLFWGLFHLSTYLLLTIHFLPLVVCLLAFVPLERLGDADRTLRPAWARRRRGADARPRGASATPSSAR